MRYISLSDWRFGTWTLSRAGDTAHAPFRLVIGYMPLPYRRYGTYTPHTRDAVYIPLRLEIRYMDSLSGWRYGTCPFRLVIGCMPLPYRRYGTYTPHTRDSVYIPLRLEIRYMDSLSGWRYGTCPFQAGIRYMTLSHWRCGTCPFRMENRVHVPLIFRLRLVLTTSVVHKIRGFL
jgi:hypothetical protein